jgi:hypothetical protein
LIVCDYITMTPAGTIDLGDGNLVLHGGSPAAIEPLIGAGRIVSAHDGTLTGLGVALASSTRGIAAEETTLFAGETVHGGDVLVKYTYVGDANLDGKIDIADYGRLDFSFPLPGAAGWFNGDFNYDGKIDVLDYGIIDFNIGVQGPQLVSAAGTAAAAAAALSSPDRADALDYGRAEIASAGNWAESSDRDGAVLAELL